jgi:hypothetical protein
VTYMLPAVVYILHGVKKMTSDSGISSV